MNALQNLVKSVYENLTKNDDIPTKLKKYTVDDICNDIIPANKIKVLENYLDLNVDFLKDTPWNVEKFYGCALWYDNILMVSLLNIFVRENDLKIDRFNVLEEIYRCNFRVECDKGVKLGYRVEYWDFEDQIKQEYLHKYGDLFEK